MSKNHKHNQRLSANSRLSVSKYGQAAALLVLALLMLQNILITSPAQAQAAVSPDIVISQVYGGGGNTGAQYNNDFIELFNRSATPVNVTGWSVQYASSTGTTWATTVLSGTISPGQYFLVQEGPGANTPAPLPTPDATGAIAMSSTNGKVALSNSATALTGGCPTGAGVIDFVGYGSANCFEGTAAAPVLSNTTAATRAGNGCNDTDQNSSDFTTPAPIPRNSSSPISPCGGSSSPTGTGVANPSAVNPGSSSLLTVTVSPGTNPTSTGITVTGNLSAIGGSTAQMFFDDGTNGDVTAGDNIFSYNAAVGAAVTPGVKMLPVVISDAQSRTGNSVISLTVNSTAPTNPTGTGMSSPGAAAPGGTTLLTVTVTPGTNPTSTGLTVTGDLSSIGGSNAQMFFDNGTNGDVTAGDNVFSFAATVSPATAEGTKSLPVSIADAQSRAGSASISLIVRLSADPLEHLLMGNPTNATTDVNNPTNYLLSKIQYAVGYHRDRGTPNWVSWHLDTNWLGSAPRQDDFRPDPSLPAGWYQVQATDYSNSGFDRGHHTPSADRTSSIPDNSATFFMTNMMPQAPDNNQGPWEQLESYSRTLVGQGKELYILAGGTGTGGTGSTGGVTNTIANGHVTVPSMTWKVILVLPRGDNDLSRVNNSTQTIAVIMPNSQGIRGTAWQNFIVSVDQVETLTGYDFFSNVPPSIQAVIESRIGLAAPRKTRADFDGDGRTDLSVFRPSEGNWYLKRSTAGFAGINWGSNGDTIVPADYDGDKKTDTAVFRPSDTAGAADFYVLNSSNFTAAFYEWGSPGDIPVPGDYDGDGKDDVALFRPSTGVWYILNSGGGGAAVYEYGINGDIPVAGDFDGDGVSDLTVFRNGQWFTRLANGESSVRSFGLTGDKLVPADYDGDGKTDLAVYRPSEATWYIERSSNSQVIIRQFGISTDIPVPGDYDGDGSDDIAVYRNGTWWINASTSGVSAASFGLAADKAIPSGYLP